MADLLHGDEMEIKEIARLISEKFAAAGHPNRPAKLEERIYRL
jgi:hypothetical protein